MMAEEAKPAEAKQETASTQPEATEAKAEETKTEKDELSDSVRKAIQSEVDKVRTKYVQAQKKLELELEETKKAKMSVEERAQYESQKAKEALETERRQFQLEQLKFRAVKILSERGIDLEAVDFVQADSEEALLARIESLSAFVKKAQKKAIDEVLKAGGRTVQQTFPGAQSALTKEQLKRMTQAQVDELMSTPEGRARAEAAFRS